MNVTLNETLHSMKMSEREQTRPFHFSCKNPIEGEPRSSANSHSIS